MMFPKPKKVKDAKYTKWLAENYNHGVKAHHLPNPGGGKRKNRDDRQVPIPYRAHYHYHHESPEDERLDMDLLEALAEASWAAYQRQDVDCATVRELMNVVIERRGQYDTARTNI